MGSESKLSAFIFGYTGGAGRSIVSALANEPSYTSVTLFGRRIVDISKNSKTGATLPGDFSKFKQEVIDFEKLSEYSQQLKGFHTGFYTLGISPFQNSYEVFKKLAYDYTMSVAKMAADGGTKYFHFMSGSAVKSNSWFAFARLCSQVEQELSSIEGFERVCVYKPAMILSDENEGGMAGRITVRFYRFVDRLRWFSVESETLGKFIVNNSIKIRSGNNAEVFTNAEINDWERQQGK